MGVGVIGTFLVSIWAFALLTLHLYRDLIVVNGVTWCSRWCSAWC